MTMKIIILGLFLSIFSQCESCDRLGEVMTCDDLRISVVSLFQMRVLRQITAVIALDSAGIFS